MANAESSTDVLSNEATTGQRKARCVQFYFVLIMSCTERALDRLLNAPHGWGTDEWRLLLQAYSFQNNARLVVMMLEVFAFPLGHERCGEQSGDDGMEDSRVREVRERSKFRNS